MGIRRLPVKPTMSWVVCVCVTSHFWLNGWWFSIIPQEHNGRSAWLHTFLFTDGKHWCHQSFKNFPNFFFFFFSFFQVHYWLYRWQRREKAFQLAFRVRVRQAGGSWSIAFKMKERKRIHDRRENCNNNQLPFDDSIRVLLYKCRVYYSTTRWPRRLNSLFFFFSFVCVCVRITAAWLI